MNKNYHKKNEDPKKWLYTRLNKEKDLWKDTIIHGETRGKEELF